MIGFVRVPGFVVGHDLGSRSVGGLGEGAGRGGIHKTLYPSTRQQNFDEFRRLFDLFSTLRSKFVEKPVEIASEKS